MLIDSGLIVGYLTAAALWAGRTSVGRSVSSLLQLLSARVKQGVGRGPVERLMQNPHDEATQQKVSVAIDAAIARDKRFAREMTVIVAALDKRGGRNLVPSFDDSGEVGRYSGVNPLKLWWFHLAILPLWTKLLWLGGLVLLVTWIIMPQPFVNSLGAILIGIGGLVRWFSWRP